MAGLGQQIWDKTNYINLTGLPESYDIKEANFLKEIYFIFIFFPQIRQVDNVLKFKGAKEKYSLDSGRDELKNRNGGQDLLQKEKRKLKTKNIGLILTDETG